MRPRATLSTLIALFALALVAAAPAAAQGDMEKTIQKALVDKLGKDAETIRVAFYDGKALLSGKVTEDSTKEIAEQVALWVPGVKKVENEVEAATKNKALGAGKIVEESEDAALETSVKDALRAELGKHADDVEVEVCDGVVSLRGTLPDKNRVGYAIAAVKKNKKVTKVVDLLRPAA